MSVATMPQKKNPHMQKLLDEAGLDIQEFSRRARLSYSQAYDIVCKGFSDGTRWGTIKKSAKALGVSISRLLQLEE